MRVTLTILCAAVIVFAGYWMLNASAVMAVLFATIALLNILVLADLHLRPGMFRGVYRMLAWLDGLAASALTVIAAFSAQQGEAVDPLMVAIIALLVVKAIVTRWLIIHPEAA